MTKESLDESGFRPDYVRLQVEEAKKEAATMDTLGSLIDKLESIKWQAYSHPEAQSYNGIIDRCIEIVRQHQAEHGLSPETDLFKDRLIAAMHEDRKFYKFTANVRREGDVLFVMDDELTVAEQPYVPAMTHADEAIAAMGELPAFAKGLAFIDPNPNATGPKIVGGSPSEYSVSESTQRELTQLANQPPEASPMSGEQFDKWINSDQQREIRVRAEHETMCPRCGHRMAIPCKPVPVSVSQVLKNVWSDHEFGISEGGVKIVLDAAGVKYVE